MSYKGIKIVHMIVFFARVFAALETVLNPVMLHAALRDFARLISFTAAAAGAVFIQKHGAKPAIQTAEGKQLVLSIKSFHKTSFCT